MLSCAGAAACHLRPISIIPKPGALLQSPPVQLKMMQTSGFSSEGFFSSSTSPSSSHVPSLSYESVYLQAKADISMHLDAFHNGLPYSLTQPEFEPFSNEGKTQSPSYDRYSPRGLTPPTHVVMPISRTDATPSIFPKAPFSLNRGSDRRYFKCLQNSGFDDQGKEHEDNDEPGLRLSVGNLHRKVKTLKCKHCDFIAVTKLSFWEHCRKHTKLEKMLCCHKCPFFTKYKNHLEYHMRNHVGYKPFQCTQCLYTCVNRYMLNSHLKSHSNVYQYRCADCNYATKYCHSLKLHLRKYQHNPAMVTNMDSTPDSLLIIDVERTHRGPRQKSLSEMFEQQPPINYYQTYQQPTPPHPLFCGHFPVNLPYLPPILFSSSHSFLFSHNNFKQSTSPKQPEMKKRTPSSSPSLLHQRVAHERFTGSGITSSPAMSLVSLPTRPTAHRTLPIQRASPPSTSVVQTNDALDLTSMKTSEFPRYHDGYKR